MALTKSYRIFTQLLQDLYDFPLSAILHSVTADDTGSSHDVPSDLLSMISRRPLSGLLRTGCWSFGAFSPSELVRNTHEAGPGKATVRLYDHSGFLDAKTCRFRLVP